MRLALVMWLLLCIPALLVAQGLWGLFWQGTSGPSFLVVAGLSVLGMVPFAVIVALADRRRPLKMPPSGTGGVLSRLAAAFLIEIATFELNTFTDQRPDWAHIKRAVGAVSLLLQLAVAALLLSAWFTYRKRAARP
jgi:hypothetical protein